MDRDVVYGQHGVNVQFSSIPILQLLLEISDLKNPVYDS